jgi:uncharacterized protein (DUF934 family)
MPLFRNGNFIDDPWIVVADAEALSDGGRSIVSWDRLSKGATTLPAYTGLLGVQLTNTTRLDELKPLLSLLSLVVVPFPAFNDGRAYSIARQIRLAGFRGEIRAIGNVLPDQLQFMIQVGIDSFEVSDRFSIETWRRASQQMSLAYQRGLYRPAGEREVWSERHQGFAAWEEQPHAG